VDYNFPEKTNLVAEIEEQPDWQTNSVLAQKHRILKAEASLPTAFYCTVKQIQADGTYLTSGDKFEAKYNFSALKIDNIRNVHQNSLDNYYLTDATAVRYKPLDTLLADAIVAIAAGISWDAFYNNPENKVSIRHLDKPDLKRLRDNF